MSWHYSQALAAAFSEGSCVGSDVSVPSKLNPTQEPSSAPARMTAHSRRSLFGTMFAPLTDTLGEELLTWFRAGFLAKTSAPQERAQESTAQSLDCGEKWRGWLARYSRDTSSWKIHQCSLFADLEPCSVTWPKWGLMRDGACWEQMMSERHTSENASGLLLPTLTVCGNYNRKGASKTSGDGLATAIKRLPTLTRHDSKNNGPSQLKRHEPGLRVVAAGGGPLNPTWCEWFMGFPLEWTALQHSETLKFQQWLNSHGIP